MEAAPIAVKQAAPIAKFFEGKTDLHSLYNVHSFIRNNLGYRRDPKGVQQIKMPNRFLNESGDCKSNALFIYAIAKNLGIPIDFRFANYRKSQGATPSHVYNVAYDKKRNKFVYVDGTSNIFGVEAKKPNFVKNGNLMKIQTLSDDMTISGKGKGKAAIKKAGQKVAAKSKAVATKAKAVVKKAAANVKNAKVGQKIKGAAATGPRIAFLGLVKLNFRGIATKLKSASITKGSSLKKKWESLGGSYNELLKVVNEGAKKKALLGINQEIGSLAVAGTAVTAATPIIVALSTFLGKLENVQKQVETIKGNPVVKKVAAALAKNKTLAAKIKGLQGKAKQTLIDELAKQTGQSPETVKAVLNEAGASAASASSGGTGAGGSDAQPEEKQQGEAINSNYKKYLKLALGAAAIGGGIYLYNQKSN